MVIGLLIISLASTNYRPVTSTPYVGFQRRSLPTPRSSSTQNTNYRRIIPAMSAEPERVFSAAKITLSDRRCRMEDDAIEALECLKSW
jgi:hypothetical protein